MPQENSYEEFARQFIAARSRTIGLALLQQWMVRLPAAAVVLDVGCGFGVPVTTALVQQGFRVQAIDGSPTLVAAFRKNLPAVQVECLPVQQANWARQSFDGIVMVGLLFLLPAQEQATLLAKLAVALRPGGKLLFSAPAQACTWQDGLTGQACLSLGKHHYGSLLQQGGLQLESCEVDDGENHYYLATKPAETVLNRAVTDATRPA